jgi:FdhD protein
MSLAKALRSNPITRIEGGGKFPADDMLAVEEPLEIRVGGRGVAVVMRTPGHDRELVAGFLVTEGVVRRRDDLLDLVFCGATGAEANPIVPEPATGGGRGPTAAAENVIDVLLAPDAPVDLERLTRHVFTSSSCGICSKASIEAVQAQFPPLEPAMRLSLRPEVLAALPERLRAAQAAFLASGGLHASALFDTSGSLELVREDVGRHNALDKVIGLAFLADLLPLSGRILLVSGRVSFELMQKALAAGIPCVAAISAPTTAAVDFARASGQALVGFLRPSGGPGRGGMRMNVYAGTLTA